MITRYIGVYVSSLRSPLLTGLNLVLVPWLGKQRIGAYRELRAYVKRISQVSRQFLLVRLILDIEFFAYTASAEFCVLHSKQNGDRKPRI